MNIEQFLFVQYPTQLIKYIHLDVQHRRSYLQMQRLLCEDRITEINNTVGSDKLHQEEDTNNLFEYCHQYLYIYQMIKGNEPSIAKSKRSSQQMASCFLLKLLLIIIVMAKRELIPVLREVLLIYRNQQSKYLLVCQKEGQYQYRLPLFNAKDGETFKGALSRGMQQLHIPLYVKGMLRMQIGHNGVDNYYRGIYFGKNKLTQERESIVFKEYEEINTISLSPYNQGIINEIHASKHIFSRDFFRENHIEDSPIPSNRRVKIDIL